MKLQIARLLFTGCVLALSQHCALCLTANGVYYSPSNGSQFLAPYRYNRTSNGVWNEWMLQHWDDASFTPGSLTTIAHWQSVVDEFPGSCLEGDCRQGQANVKVFFEVERVQSIETHTQLANIHLRLYHLWNASWLACSPLDSMEYWSYEQCEASGVDCFLHPPMVTPRQWRNAAADARQAAKLVPCNKPGLMEENSFSIQSFKDQFFRPVMHIIDEVSILQLPGEALSVRVPDETCASSRVKVWYERSVKVTIKTKLDLNNFPFDSNYIYIQYIPGEAESFPEVSYGLLKASPDPCWPLDGRQLSSRAQGTKASAYQIGSIRSQLGQYVNVQRKSYTTVTTSIEITRQAAEIVWSVMIPVFLVWLCSFLLFWIEVRVPPAAAGAVIGQIVLILITSNQLSASISRLPSSLGTCYLTIYIAIIMFVQVLQLLAHLLRVIMVYQKLFGTLDLMTIIFRYTALSVQMIAQPISALSFFPDSTAWSISVLVLGVMVAILGVLHTRLYQKRLQKAENEDSLSVFVNSDVVQDAKQLAHNITSDSLAPRRWSKHQSQEEGSVVQTNLKPNPSEPTHFCDAVAAV